MKKLLKKLFAGSALLFLMLAQTAKADEMQIYSNEQQEENSNLLILDFDGDSISAGENVILQFGDALGEQLYWDTTNGQFVFTDDVDVQGDITLSGSVNMQVGETVDGVDVSELASDVSTNTTNIGTNASDISTIEGNIGNQTYTEDNYVTDAETVTASIDALDQALNDVATGASAATGTTSNSYVLDTDNTGGNVVLQFGGTLNESLTWNSATSQFDLSDDLNIAGNISLTGTVDGVDVSTLATTVGTNTSNISTNAGNIATNAGDIATIEGNIGDQLYTEENIITDSESTTDSLDAIDMAIGDQAYTNNTYLTDGQTVTASLDALEQALDGIATGTSDQAIFISMNDLNVTEDGTANRVNLYTDTEGTSGHRYYILKTKQASVQDLDLKFKVKLPEDFKDWDTASGNNLNFYYKNTGTSAQSKIDVLVEDSAGTDSFAAANGASLHNTSWTNFTQDFTAGTYTAGDYIYVTVKGYGSYGAGTYYAPYLGEIVLRYNSKSVQSN